MSKERAQRRAERLAVTQRKLAAEQVRLEAERARASRRLPWTRWREALRRRAGRRSARTRERRATIASALLVVVVTTYLMSRSISLVIGVLLVAMIVIPALVAVLPDRSKR